MEVPNMLAENGLKIAYDLAGNGKVFKIYYDGKLCRLARIEGHAAKKVAAYQAMLNDVFKMCSYLELVCEMAKEKFQTGLPVNEFDFKNKDQVLCSSLYFSAITLYGKCFTKAEGRRVKLEDVQLRKYLSDSQMETHEKLMRLRHNWAAHGGHSDHESVCGIMAFLPEGQVRSLYIASSTGFPSLTDLESFSALGPLIISVIEEQKTKHEAKVFKGEDIQAYLSALQENAEYFVFVGDADAPTTA